MKLPKGHQTVMPYLIIPEAKKFLDFTKTVFGAKEMSLHLREDNTVMHGEVMIGDTTIMFGNSSDQWRPLPGSLYIYSQNVDKDYQLALSHGAKSILEPEDKPYGRSCGVEDPCGNVWWITSVVD